MVKSYAKFEVNWKHRVIEKFSLNIQKLFSIARNVYQKAKGVEPACSPAYTPLETSKGYNMTTEQRKAETVALLLKKNLEIQ